ncbi:hypothetical protein ARMGADRAFT_523195 [Armillaria gallica]|uniref:Uncharacterized protein n=1 Tax=Armillaria gallica TaxID=47427 RepID=A0A2H3E0S2_ARMGA|nr:hypothetical protein ARMGADRAFT_523195 [Armillaria gallica]
MHSESNMPTYPPHTKKIRRCFFFSLAFVIVIPIICTVLGSKLHPQEFAYKADDDTSDDSTRKISLHSDLISADLKQGTMVLDWSVWEDTCPSDCSVANDTCLSSECTVVNIYFDTNLLHHSDIGDIQSSGNNRPVDPIFIWNATADNDRFSNIATFRTELAVFPPDDFVDDDGTKPSVRDTLSSEVYYPFDRYLAAISAFAEDASSNATVPLSLESTSGLAVGLKISAVPLIDEVEGIPERIAVLVTLERATSVKCYCIIITIIFWLITLMICLVMIMTVGFGFQQRNEIVVVPVATVFAFTQLRSTMPGAPDGFGDILDFVGVLPCLVLLSISAVTMVGIYVFTDPAKDSREKLTWSALVNAVRPRKAPSETVDPKNNTVPLPESYSMLSLSKD